MSKASRLMAGPLGPLGLLVVLLSGLIAVPSAQAQQNYKLLYSFSCGVDGAYPEGALVGDSAGNLYGTTAFGGAFGFGTVFEVSASGTETVLHSFAGFPTDGRRPVAGLVRDAAGNLYGTTEFGGAFDFGTVFEVSASGTETVLHSFANFPDGRNPVARLWRDNAGNLYGATAGGGSSTCFGDGCGVVFEINPTTGQETILHNFSGPPADGQAPLAGLFAQGGKLYGTTQLGGANQCGTVFAVKPVIATESNSQ